MSQEPLAETHSFSPHSSSTPLISSAQLQGLQQVETPPDEYINEKSQQKAKRHLLGLGKKKDTKPMATPGEAGKLPQIGAEATAILPASSMSKQQQEQQSGAKTSPQTVPLSPSRLARQATTGASPSRLRSSSPRLHSPGDSEIFERNVQEPLAISNLQGELNPARIPAHVITEDSIPPALEASAQAITSSSLNPDEVEIVTSSSHQPAASGIEGHADLSQFHPAPLLHHSKSDDTASSFLQHSGSLEDDGASSYGQLDPNDVRRLSFISFQDIVREENQQIASSALGEPGSRNSLHFHDRTGSPIRLPRSPTTAHSQSLGGLTTPPTSVNMNPVASTAEQSPARSIIGLPSPVSQHGDLNIETMRQALRKTASGDLGGGRSAGMSPVSDHGPLSRTNS